jgi:hypothetical protein
VFGIGLFGIGGLGPIGAALAMTAAPSAEGHQVCVQAAREAERDHGITPHLLGAISLAETGRWSSSRKASLAWPWTVMAEGKGRYLPTKAAAIAEVRALKARGITNIDVGCFQVNMYYHGDAFETLEQAFDPVENASYAGAFLSDLKRRSGNWKLAVGRYHSWDEERGPAYQARVFKLWTSQRDHLAQTANLPALAQTDQWTSNVGEERMEALRQERAERARQRSKTAAMHRMLEAQRQANRRFLIQQRKIQEARMQTQFENKRQKVMAEYEEMLRQRRARTGS